MTKAEEMQRYDEFLRKLPQDSYLRPWLHHVRDHVETAIRCDVIPEFTPQETFRQCQQSRKDAADYIHKCRDEKRREADRLITSARTEAKRITDAAEAEAEEIRRTFRSDIRTLRQALQNVA